MAVIDLRDAYYSVPICTKDRRYLRFQHSGALYDFVCFPNGLSSAPRIFTKLLKPVFSKLKSEGVLLISYIDDIILIADDPATLLQRIRKTTELLTSLAFTIHSENFALIPSQCAVFLGFLIDTVAMTVNMTTVKADKVKSAINALLEPAKPKIRQVASVVGLMVSSFPGVRYGPLYYRTLENAKTDMLKISGGNLDNYMFLSELAVTDLHWWLENGHKDPNPISLPPSQLTLKCDISLSGCGAVVEGTSNTTNGRWSSLESMQHINYLEIKAILFGLKALCSHLHNCHVKILTNNQTTVTYLRNMGGSQSRNCNAIARETILWCRERNISHTITHLPGKLNVEADKASRVFHDDTEWSLDHAVFDNLVARWGKPDINLSATRLNTKLPCYVSWKPEPEAVAVDAFTLDWSKYNLVYCFPPFSVIGKVLQQLIQTQVRAILVLPDWCHDKTKVHPL